MPHDIWGGVGNILSAFALAGMLTGAPLVGGAFGGAVAAHHAPNALSAIGRGAIAGSVGGAATTMLILQNKEFVLPSLAFGAVSGGIAGGIKYMVDHH